MVNITADRHGDMNWRRLFHAAQLFRQLDGHFAAKELAWIDSGCPHVCSDPGKRGLLVPTNVRHHLGILLVCGSLRLIGGSSIIAAIGAMNKAAVVPVRRERA